MARLCYAARRRLRQRAEAVAVQVNDAVRQREEVTVCSEWVCKVASLQFLQRLSFDLLSHCLLFSFFFRSVWCAEEARSSNRSGSGERAGYRKNASAVNDVTGARALPY